MARGFRPLKRQDVGEQGGLPKCQSEKTTSKLNMVSFYLTSVVGQLPGRLLERYQLSCSRDQLVLSMQS